MRTKLWQRSCVQIKLCNNYKLLLKSCIVLQQLVVADQDAGLRALPKFGFWWASFGAADRGRKRSPRAVVCCMFDLDQIEDCWCVRAVLVAVSCWVCSPRSLIELMSLKSLQIAKKTLRSSCYEDCISQCIVIVMLIHIMNNINDCSTYNVMEHATRIAYFGSYCSWGSQARGS